MLPSSASADSSNSDIAAMQHEKYHDEVRLHGLDRDGYNARDRNAIPQTRILVPTHKQTPEPIKGPCKASVIKAADEAYEYLVKTGCHKDTTPVWRIVWLGILAGVYIGIGYALASVVAGQVGRCVRTYVGTTVHSSKSTFGQRTRVSSTCSTVLLVCLLA